MQKTTCRTFPPAMCTVVLLAVSLLASRESATAEQVHVYRLSPMAVAPDNSVPKGLESIFTPISLRIAPGQLDDLVLSASRRSPSDSTRISALTTCRSECSWRSRRLAVHWYDRAGLWPNTLL